MAVIQQVPETQEPRPGDLTGRHNDPGEAHKKTGDAVTTDSRATSSQAVFLLSLPLFAMLGAVLMAPLLPRIEAEFAGSPHVDLLVPLMLTAPALCLALLSPAAGALTDRFGARNVVLISLLAYGVAGTAPIYLHSLSAILASRLLVGVAEAGLVTGSTALLGLCFDSDANQKWFALQSFILPLLGSVVVAATGVLADHGWRLAFIVYGISLVALVAGLRLVPRARAPLEERAAARGWPPVRIIVLIACIAIPGSVFFYLGPVQVAYLLAHRGYDAPSTASLVTSIGMIAGPPVVLLTRRMRRLSVGFVIGIGMALMGLGMLLMATGRTPTIIAAGLVIQQGGGAMMYATAIAYTVSLATAETQGAYSGTFYLIYSLAQFATPFATSAAMALVGDRLTSILAFAAAAVVVAVLIATARPMRRRLVV